jgi:Flp pilus assembly protein TadD
MLRVPGSLLSFAAVLLLAAVFCPPLAAQRRPDSNPFPDDEIGLSPSRGRSYTVSGVVADADSHLRIEGARVDLQGLSGGVLSTEFTSTNGAFAFVNVRMGSYQLIFQQVGYQDSREQVEVEGPVFGITVAMRKLSSEEPAGGPTVSVRQLSMPQKARTAMSKGMNLLYQKTDYPGSIKQFERAIQAYPDFYEAYTQMGVAYMKMKDPVKSEQALRKSVELSQEHYPEALYMLAALLLTDKRVADAEPLARKAVALDPNSWHAQSELAQALLKLERPEEAEEHAQAAVKLQPESPILRLLLADAHIALRNGPALLEDLNTYLRLAPNGPFAPQVREQRDRVQQRLQNSQAAPAESSSSSQANP